MPASTRIRSPFSWPALRLAVAPCAALWLAACGGGLLEEEGRVRLVNATTDSTPLDLYDGSDRIVRDVGSYAASGFAGLESGAYTFDVLRGGVAATRVSADVEEERDLSVLVTSSAGNVTATVIREDEDEPSSGFAKLRFFNAASGSVGAVDAYVTAGECAALETTPLAPVASALSGMQSGWAQVVAAGNGTSYQVCVTLAGDRGDVRLAVPGFVLESRQVVTFVLGETAGGVLLNGGALVQGEAFTAFRTGQSRVRMAAGVAPGTAASAVVAGSTFTLTGPNVLPYRAVTAGDTTVAASVGPASTSQAVSLVAGGDATLVVAGTAAAPLVALIPDDNRASTSTARPVRMRFVNGSATASSATLSVDNVPIGGAVAPGAATPYVSVESSAALAKLEVFDANGASLCSQDNRTLSAGRVYTLFLLGPAPSTCILRTDR